MELSCWEVGDWDCHHWLVDCLQHHFPSQSLCEWKRGFAVTVYWVEQGRSDIWIDLRDGWRNAWTNCQSPKSPSRQHATWTTLLKADISLFWSFQKFKPPITWHSGIHHERNMELMNSDVLYEARKKRPIVCFAIGWLTPQRFTLEIAHLSFIYFDFTVNNNSIFCRFLFLMWIIWDDFERHVHIQVETIQAYSSING